MTRIMRLFLCVSIFCFVVALQGCAEKSRYSLNALGPLSVADGDKYKKVLIIRDVPATNPLGDALFKVYEDKMAPSLGWSEGDKRLANNLRDFGGRSLRIHMPDSSFGISELKNASLILAQEGYYNENMKVTVYGANSNLANFRAALLAIMPESNLSFRDTNLWPIPEKDSLYVMCF